MNSHNTMFYSTASSGYIQYAVTSLLTIRDYISDAQLTILGSVASDYEKSLMDDNKIEFITLDLKDRFTQVWDYPIETYYIFAGPELFQDQGYQYSVYIDGDILCKDNPLADMPKVRCIGGVASAKVNGRTIDIFGDDWATIKEIYQLPKTIESRDRINAGVVYFNNQKMKNLKLLDRATDIYKTCLDNDIPRKGDDSLFSLLQMVFMQDGDLEYLDSGYNYVLQFNPDWRMPLSNLKFFHFSIDKPWKDSPYRHDNSALDIFNPYIKEWRSKFLSITGDKQIEELERDNKNLINKLRLIETSKSWKLAKVLQKISPKSIFNRIKEYRTESLKLPRHTRELNANTDIKTWYWIAWDYYGHGKNMFNFGDVCTVDIVREIFGFNLVWTPIDKCDLIGTGSIIQVAQNEAKSNKINVWGSGFIDEGSNNNLNNLSFFAVRGHLTRERINKHIAVGDPGILASLAYGRSGVKSDKIGVILHYKDGDLPLSKLLRADNRFRIISPLDSPHEVAHAISECRFILSSSLHGLIFADSYNIPNAWIQPSNKLDGGSYKFMDYCSGVNKKLVKADISQIFDDLYIEQLIRGYRPIAVRKIQKRLIKAFPYN